VLIVHRIRWRPTVMLLLCLLIGIDLASTLVRSSGLLTALRLCHGVTGGLLVGVSYAVIARTRSPDRCFGALMVVQSSLGGLGLMFLPRLVPVFGSPVLFLALAAFSAVALALLPFLPDFPRRVASATTALKAQSRAGLTVALLAVFFFQAGNMALSAYIIELGRAYGLGLEFVSMTIGVSGWIASVGALLVVAFGARFGRTWPIALGILFAAVGNAAFHGSASAGVYFTANIITAIVWFFVISYLLGLSAAFDAGGRAAPLAGFFSKLGLASGPYAASLIVGHDPAYSSIINWAVVALVVAGICGVYASRRLESAVA
jgi:predicted MFS family arabinose efflux permease